MAEAAAVLRCDANVSLELCPKVLPHTHKAVEAEQHTSKQEEEKRTLSPPSWPVTVTTGKRGARSVSVVTPAYGGAGSCTATAMTVRIGLT